MSCPRCNNHAGPASHLCTDHYRTFLEYLEDHPPTPAQRAADALVKVADRLRHLDRYPDEFRGREKCRISEGETALFVDVAVQGMEINLTIDIEQPESKPRVPVTFADFDGWRAA